MLFAINYVGIVASLAKSEYRTFPWLQKSGGPVRNEFMVSMLIGLKMQGHPIGVETFPSPESRGTINVIDQVLYKGRYGLLIPIWIYGKNDRNAPATTEGR